MNDLYEVDRPHREFGRTVVDCIDAHVTMGDLIEKARGRHHAVASAAHDRFVRLVERSEVFFLHPSLMNTA